MIWGNGWGFAILVIGGLLGGMSSYFLKLKDPQAMVILGTIWVLIDLILRLRSRYQPRWFLNRRAGGSLWSIPLWVLGLVILLVSIPLVIIS